MRKPSLNLLTILSALLILVLSSAKFTPVVIARPPQQAAYAGKLEAYLQAQMKTYKIPGMAVAIVRDGEVQYLNGLGTANANRDPVTPDTPFLLASVSKSITALGVMQLVDDGKIKLDDPVKQYLPWFDVAGGEGGKISVADLLYQTSGLSELGGIRATLRPDAQDALKPGCAACQRYNSNSSQAKGGNIPISITTCLGS
jgi:CubicO group peptidase (beta-lactamase class C family)